MSIAMAKQAAIVAGAWPGLLLGPGLSSINSIILWNPYRIFQV